MTEPTTAAGRRHLTTHDPAFFRSFDIAWSGVLAIEIEAATVERTRVLDECAKAVGEIWRQRGWLSIEDSYAKTAILGAIEHLR